MRILYVEDNQELRETIGMLMEGEGRTVVPCETAEEALELDGASHFDVVITDVSLPGISGTELAKKLLAKNAQRWVVLCTGYELGAHAKAWGPHVRTLRKPFEIDELDALLAHISSAVGDSSVSLPV